MKLGPDAYLEARRQLGVEPGKRVIVGRLAFRSDRGGCGGPLFVIGIPSVPGIDLSHADLIATSLESERCCARARVESR